MTIQKGVVLQKNDAVVATKCFSHPKLGNIHTGTILQVERGTVVTSDIIVKYRRRGVYVSGSVSREYVRRSNAKNPL